MNEGMSCKELMKDVKWGGLEREERQLIIAVIVGEVEKLEKSDYLFGIIVVITMTMTFIIIMHSLKSSWKEPVNENER